MKLNFTWFPFTYGLRNYRFFTILFYIHGYAKLGVILQIFDKKLQKLIVAIWCFHKNLRSFSASRHFCCFSGITSPSLPASS